MIFVELLIILLMEEGNLDIKKNNLLNFKKNFDNKNFDNLIIKKIWDLIDEFKISKKIISDLFDGIESDLKEKVQFTSQKRFADLFL